MENLFNSQNTYWNNNGKYQSYQEEMYKLVPSRGEVNIEGNEELTVAIENLRQINRLYYDFYNNGCCNVVDVLQDTCEDCGGSGFEDEDDDEDFRDCGWCNGDGTMQGDPFISSYYEDFVPNLERYTNMKIEKVLLNCGSNYGRYGFPDSDCEKLEKFTDEVMKLSWETYQKHKSEIKHKVEIEEFKNKQLNLT